MIFLRDFAVKNSASCIVALGPRSVPVGPSSRHGRFLLNVRIPGMAPRALPGLAGTGLYCS